MCCALSEPNTSPGSIRSTAQISLPCSTRHQPVFMASDTWAQTLPDSEKPSILIEAVGHQVGTVNHAIEAAAYEAHIFCFGIVDDPTYPIDMKKVQRKELTLYSGTTPFTYRRNALAKAAAYVKAHPGLAEAYTTSMFPSQEIQKAFECAERPAKGRIKVVIGW